MYIITLLDLRTNKTFEKVFYNERLKDNFVRKVGYSKKLKVLSIWKY